MPSPLFSLDAAPDTLGHYDTAPLAANGQAKDYEFSARSTADHWASGLADLRRTLSHPDWLAPPAGHASSVTHDVHRGAVRHG